MTEWTESARRAVDEYCARSTSALGGTGADATEVADDLRHHIEEEVRRSRVAVVTEDIVRRILARFGEPAREQEPPAQSGGISASSPDSAKVPAPPGYFILLPAVLLPLVTLIFEWISGTSAGVLFDPIPNTLHVLAVLSVPLVNLGLWWAGREKLARFSGQLGWLNGIAIGICIYYCIVYLLFVPFATLGILFFGLGLIPLSPYIALMATPYLRSVYGRRIGRARLPGRWGILAGLVFMLLLQVPAGLTHYGLAQAVSGDKNRQLRGIQILRNFGDKELLLRASYGLLDRDLDLNLVRQIASGGIPVSAEQAREVYYRVTGTPLNSVPPPALYTRAGRWSVLEDEFTWDNALGGDAVAGRVKGLSLMSSRMDAAVESDASIVYCEWTMEFKNISSQQREARAQVALPPGGVVSKVSLWINGEEREAAFAGRAQVREAYQEVAVIQRHDPVLVTTCGPDRILMQCFPVPPGGGVMKVRVGITAPLLLRTKATGDFVWPKFLERNFGIAPNLKHTLWAGLLNTRNSTNHDTDTTLPARNTLFREAVLERDFATGDRFLQIKRNPDINTVWTESDKSGEVIEQTIEPFRQKMPSRLVVVIDGSKGMSEAAREIAKALSGVPRSMEVSVIIAGDELDETPNFKAANSSVSEQAQQTLSQTHFVGGQDNVPALEAALELAVTGRTSAIVWIHRPQPVLLASESRIRQSIERTGAGISLYEIQVGNGPDRILEKLDGLSAVKHVPRLGSVETDFKGLIQEWTGEKATWRFSRKKVAAPASGEHVSRHIERLWAKEEAMRLARLRLRNAAIQIAAVNQLVTPVTGAVVLETKQQYDQHNLTPADPMTVPAIPEPGVFTLVALAGAIWVAGRITKRTIRRKSGS